MAYVLYKLSEVCSDGGILEDSERSSCTFFFFERPAVVLKDIEKEQNSIF